MCGVVAIYGTEGVSDRIYDSLSLLQHRGQDAAGIITCDQGGKLNLRKDNGLVKDVFRPKHLKSLSGAMGIGHVRYPTAGCSSVAEAQPFYVNSPYGLAIAHNGNLTNVDDLRKEVYAQDRRHINTTSDSEVLLNVLAHEIQALDQGELSAELVFEAIKNLHNRIRGAYSVTALIPKVGIFAFRDPMGIRPLSFGERETEKGTEVIIASESVAIEAMDFTLVRDVAPGEAIFVGEDGVVKTMQCAEESSTKPCLFEYVYFARPDSKIDGVSVYESRLKMGEMLGKKVKNEFPEHDIDVVIPIPDTSRTSALDVAHELDVRYREGFIKNRYVARTFIMPEQSTRRKSVRMKLNPIDSEIKGKNVLLVDDSIVRGTTSKRIVKMARDVGANKVYMASAAPPVRFPNVYGIDMPSANEFVAHGKNVEEIAAEIGVDRLFYQDLSDLEAAVKSCSGQIDGFDASCFNGIYNTGDVNDDFLADWDEARHQGGNCKPNKGKDIVDVHNGR